MGLLRPATDRFRCAAALLFAFSTLSLLLLTGTASASEFGIVPGSFAVSPLDAEGNPDARAGAHPDELRVEFALNAEGTTARDLIFDMPPGLQGNPGAVPDCPRELVDREEECPPETQVGSLSLGGGSGSLPIFKVEPLPGQIMAFASKPPFNLSISTELRPGDLGVTFAARDIPHQAIPGGEFILWGIPADHQTGTSIPRRPFLTDPAHCGPMHFSFRTRSWEEGAPWLEANSESVPLVGCGDLGFAPRIAAQLSDPIADSPTGVRLDLDAPQEEDASELVEAQIGDVDITMPAGIGISPGSASGLLACSDDEIGLGNGEEAHCPPASRVGEVEFTSALTPQPSSGSIYLGKERPGERVRIFIVMPVLGATIKLAGALVVDPHTGRMSTALHGLPEVGLQRMTLSFDGGPHALLASPLTCGSSIWMASFSSQAGPKVDATAPVTIAPRTPGVACAGAAPFAPTVTVTRSSHRAGRPTAISVRLGRKDGEQLPGRFTFFFPPGLSMALGSVQLCSEAEVGACPEASRIGAAAAAIGSGSSLATLQGGAFLTGPYHGAPYGLAIELPARIGPFDLGGFTLRGALRLNGRTGAVSLLSDRIPDSIEGIPIRFRTIDLNLDRGGLMRNPTSCGTAAVKGVLEAHSGDTSTTAGPFEVSGCRKLGFSFHPRLTLDAGKGTQHSVLRFSARFGKGGAGLRSLKLVLPRGLKLDSAGVKEICSRPDATAGLCAHDARIGAAFARSPILPGRLSGPIFVVQPEGDGEPDLAVSLQLGSLHVDMRGRTRKHRGQLVANLVALPDMPLRTFSMTLGNAKTGGISLEGTPCAGGRGRKLRASILATAQNGEVRRMAPQIEVKPGCPRTARSGEGGGVHGAARGVKPR